MQLLKFPQFTYEQLFQNLQKFLSFQHVSEKKKEYMLLLLS
jgi:hypothetical protein